MVDMNTTGADDFKTATQKKATPGELSKTLIKLGNSMDEELPEVRKNYEGSIDRFMRRVYPEGIQATISRSKAALMQDPIKTAGGYITKYRDAAEGTGFSEQNARLVALEQRRSDVASAISLLGSETTAESIGGARNTIERSFKFFAALGNGEAFAVTTKPQASKLPQNQMH